MHTTYRLLASLMLVTACETTGEADLGSSAGPAQADTVRLALSAEGGANAQVQIAATSTQGGQAVAKQTAQLDAQGKADVGLKLPAGDWKVQVDAFADQAKTKLTGSASATTKVAASAVSQLALHLKLPKASAQGSAQGSAQASAQGSGQASAQGSAQGKGEASGSVSTSTSATAQANAAPVLSAVQVTTAADGVAIALHVTDPDGDALTFQWQGAGIGAEAQAGSSTAKISAQALATWPGALDIHVVVQDSAGHALKVKLHLQAGIGGLVQASATSEIESATVQADAKAQGCWNVHAQCVVACNAQATTSSAQAECKAGCAAKLVVCN